ncbi:hypothetical protein [Candidatus Halobonum tyrrellensis]|uniref:Uncharacterized protein n=1 Tax=Candidatus Halobonum tyrrellensis G22 TaxID=1324957 RepID=V4HI19_9EURY|nr:hypothetical protein [Candidatus Halobonum tyrrellensis]ESP89403.1 hypothetical protein K933_04206 [Candidatus Halobonum tyrrellensis G22]
MPKEIPTEEKSVRERGTYAEHGDDATLASYLSSLFFLLSVPGLVLVAYAGYWSGWYDEPTVVPVFAGLFVAALAVAFGVMHVRTGR